MTDENDLIVERESFGSAWPERFPDARLVAGFEGSAVYEAEGEDAYWLIKDEGTMADFLDPVQDAGLLAGLVALERYTTREARDAAADEVRRRRDALQPWRRRGDG